MDGMRAVAILSVLLFHTGLYSNGLFGVDLFFLLSGFLITLTMLREYHRTGIVHLGRFYSRRAKRLLPLLALTLGVTLLAVYIWGSRAELTRFGEQALASLVYLTNWEQIASGQEYWDGFGALNPLGHMWSLAITEQFYLVWPVLLLSVLLLGRMLSRRGSGGLRWQRSPISALLVLLVGGIGAIVAAAQPALRFDGTNADRMYLGTDTHTVGLFVGAVMAAISYLLLQYSGKNGQRARTGAGVVWGRVITWVLMSTLSLAALLGIIILSVRATSYEEPWLYRFGFTAVALLGGILVLTLTCRRNLISRLFAWPPLVETGRISYTLFLVHLPVYWTIQAVDPTVSPADIAILGIPLSLGLASGLHHLVGEPIRLRHWARRGTALFTGLMVTVTAAVLVVPELVQRTPEGHGETRVLTLGDSLANDLASALSRNASAAFTVTDGGIPGCGISGSSAQRTRAGIEQPSPRGCLPWQERWREEIRSTRPSIIVVHIAWDAVEQEIDGVWTDLTDPGFADRYRSALEEAIEVTAMPGTRVLLANARLHNGILSPEQGLAFNRILAAVLRDHPGIELLDLQGQLCSDEECGTQTEEGEDRYLDDRVHFSPAGKREIAPWLSQELLRAPAGEGSDD
ncbi:acyltransferase family protein [Leucobacter luti]|uniref:DUF459 domain-containing protein n=1 Tax=Leucobacter luti TaxID=340320 RepID=UPI001060B92F